MKFATKAIHAGQEPDPSTGAIMTPVYLTSTFVQDAPAVHRGYEYSRSGNPTRTALEANLAALEGAKFGLCFASGLAAENTLLHCLASGDHVVCARDVYGGTFRLFDKVWKQLGVSATFINAYNIDEISAAIQPQTKLLWLESPTNPLLTITDLAAASEIAHRRKVKVVVDNTFASPCLQQPLALGADIVLHSTTKYLGGHSDVVGGAIATSDEELYTWLKFMQNAAGGRWIVFSCSAGRRHWPCGCGSIAKTRSASPNIWPVMPKSKKFIIPGCPTIPITAWPPGK
jgi:cystathionine gamma-lyase